MICESVPLQEVLLHIEATQAPDCQAPVSAAVQRGHALSRGEDVDDASDDVVFHLVKRRSAA